METCIQNSEVIMKGGFKKHGFVAGIPLLVFHPFEDELQNKEHLKYLFNYIADEVRMNKTEAFNIEDFIQKKQIQFLCRQEVYDKLLIKFIEQVKDLLVKEGLGKKLFSNKQKRARYFPCSFLCSNCNRRDTWQRVL